MKMHYTVITESPSGSVCINSFQRLEDGIGFAASQKHPARVYRGTGVLSPLSTESDRAAILRKINEIQEELSNASLDWHKDRAQAKLDRLYVFLSQL